MRRAAPTSVLNVTDSGASLAAQYGHNLPPLFLHRVIVLVPVSRCNGRIPQEGWMRTSPIARLLIGGVILMMLNVR